MLKSGVMLMAAVVMWPGYQDPAAFKPFSSEAGRFTVSMPGQPKEDATTVKTAVGEIKVFNFQVEVDEGVYIVGYSDYPEKFVRASSPDKMLDGGVNGMMTSSKGTVLSLKKVTRDGFPGRELSYTMKGPAGEKALGRAHLLLVNSRVYQVVVVGKESMSKSATADSFLASFKFKPGPALTAVSAEPASAARAEKSTAAFAPFSSDAGRFEVSMPGEPKETRTTVKTAVGDIKVFMFEVDHRDGDYVVGFSDYPEKILRASGPDAALEGGQKGAVNGVKGTLLTSKKIKQDGFPGLEFSYNLTAAGVPGKALGRSRLILVKNRLYQVVVIAALSKAKSAANDAFFDSFKFDAGPATEQAVAAAPAKKAPPRATRLRNAAPAPRSRIANMPRGPVQRRPSAKGSQAAVDSAKWVVWNLDDKPGGISIRVPSQTPERREEAGILGADKRDVFTWADGDVELHLPKPDDPRSRAGRRTGIGLGCGARRLREGDQWGQSPQRAQGVRP